MKTRRDEDEGPIACVCRCVRAIYQERILLGLEGDEIGDWLQAGPEVIGDADALDPAPRQPRLTE